MASETVPQGDKPTAPRDIELLDRASALSIKLDALLGMTYGEQGEAFRMIGDELQDAYLWACSDMANELKECVKRVCTMPT